MSQVLDDVDTTNTMDPYEIGWYIESADEETYGPVARRSLRQFLDEGAISPNTLVRHCSQPEARPLADQTGLRELTGLEKPSGTLADAADPMADRDLDPPAYAAPRTAIGDRMDEVWPRKKRDQNALAESDIPCARHKKPAVLVCVRCHAPYCNRCRMKPFRKAFFLCRKCHVGMHNRRFLALILDVILLVYIPLFAIQFALSASGVLGDPMTALAVNSGINLMLSIGLYAFGRDALFKSASPGKRAMGLRVVRSTDGESPIHYGQGIVRWLSQFIPIFNLVDAIAPYYDPLMRRYGDRWAGTRVTDTETKLEKARDKVADRLINKGIQPPQTLELSMTDLARLA